MNNFNMIELVQLAINIEKRGMEFYDAAYSSAADSKAKDLYKYLYNEEVKHLKLFTELYNHIKDIVSIGDDYLFDENVSAYLKSLVKEEVFKTSVLQENNNKSEIDSIVREALKAEKNSILFYTELALHTKDEEILNILDILIDEEKKHLVELTTLLNVA